MNGLMMQPIQPSAAAIQKLEEATLRVRTPNTALALWQRVFSEQEKARLGDDLEAAYKKGGAVAMWSAVHGCTKVRAVIEIAHTLNLLTSSDRRWLLREAGELLDADAAYDDAIQRNELVLNASLKEIYWKGERIEFDWSKHEAKWTFLWELACHAKADLPIDYTIFGETKNQNYPSKTKSEIGNLDCFPLDLTDAIESLGKGEQKLQIAAEEIRLFERHLGGEFREWTP